MIKFTIPGLRLPNHSNGSRGVSVAAMHARRREAEQIRGNVATVARARMHGLRLAIGTDVTVTVTRCAPSVGLDAHDNLRTAAKPAVDGLADALGVANDRDPRVSWVYNQRRAPWAVEVTIARRETCPHCGAVVRDGRAA